jgi:hypothetical protein
MVDRSLLFWLVFAITIIDGLLAGASMDQSLEQLPSRRRIGARAYSAYGHASHAANGRFWLIPLAIGGAVLTIAVAIWAMRLDLTMARALPLYVGAGFAIAHSLSTVKAAGINVTQWRSGVDDAALERILDRYARWQGIRAALQLVTFFVAAWALAANAVMTGSPS